MVAKRSSAPKSARWSQHVTETSDAMDLKPDVFTGDDPEAIARSLKSSAEHSDRRRSGPYRSAMSMLTFYINRAGHKLAPAHRTVLEKAKDALRGMFGKPPARTAAAKKTPKKAPAATKTAARTIARTAEKTAAKTAATATAKTAAKRKSPARSART